MWRILAFIFGLKYVYWQSSFCDGISILHRTAEGKYYFKSAVEDVTIFNGKNATALNFKVSDLDLKED